MTTRSRKLAAARSGERGFTLAETALALLVMMVASIGIVSLFTYAIKYNAGAKDRELAMAVAQRRMESLRNIPFDATTRAKSYATGGLAATASGGVSETTTSAGRSYTVVTTIANDGGATDAASTLKTITIQVTPYGANTAMGQVTLVTKRSIILMGTN